MKRDKNIKITPKTHEILKSYCDEKGLKMFQFVETLIKEGCKPNGVNKPSKSIYGDD